MGISLGDGLPDNVQRTFVIVGIYKILLKMKLENDYRSGIFRVMYIGVIPAWDIYIRPSGSLGFIKNASESVANITLLAPSPSAIAYDITNISAPAIANERFRSIFNTGPTYPPKKTHSTAGATGHVNQPRGRASDYRKTLEIRARRTTHHHHTILQRNSNHRLPPRRLRTALFYVRRFLRFSGVA